MNYSYGRGEDFVLDPDVGLHSGALRGCGEQLGNGQLIGFLTNISPDCIGIDIKLVH
jgi:hypothetical protein